MEKCCWKCASPTHHQRECLSTSSGAGVRREIQKVFKKVNDHSAMRSVAMGNLQLTKMEVKKKIGNSPPPPVCKPQISGHWKFIIY
jgi:hypothetical protein